MQLVEEWLSAHNLPTREGRRLEGEALRYAVVTFLRRPNDLPPEVLTLLAEDYFSAVSPDSGVN
jgi:hypothetical protein